MHAVHTDNAPKCLTAAEFSIVYRRGPERIARQVPDSKDATMTILNTRALKAALLGACAAVTLGSAVHAESTATIVAESGQWTATQISYDTGATSCTLATKFRDIGQTVMLAAVDGEQKLRVFVIYDNWSTSSDFNTSLDFVFDGENVHWGKEGNARATKNNVGATIAPLAAPAFVHSFTAGSIMRVTVGSATSLPVGLAGTTAVWGAFMDCAKIAAPAIVASINPSAVAAVRPPSAVAPAQQPAISEVGLLTHDGVKHVRGVAGSTTAIMFVLDSGAAAVQLPATSPFNSPWKAR